MSHDNLPFTLKLYNSKNMLNCNVVKEMTIFARPNLNVCKFHVWIGVNIWSIVLCGLDMRQPQKSNKRSMAETITGETKREGQRTFNSQEPKKGRKLVPLMVQNYFTHNPSSVPYIQIMRYNNNGRSRTSITCQHNLPLYNKG